jgi:aarF domain-containing kinase
VQFVASSPTIFPAEYVEEMQALLDSAPPVPWPTIRHVFTAANALEGRVPQTEHQSVSRSSWQLCRAIIAEDLGVPLESAFSFVNEVPLATASIAQVHRAVHRKSGKEVVIKVGAAGTVLQNCGSTRRQARAQ